MYETKKAKDSVQAADSVVKRAEAGGDMREQLRRAGDYDAQQKLLRPEGAEGGVDLAVDVIEVLGDVAKSSAYRGYNVLDRTRALNSSGNFRGMTKSAGAANLGKGLGTAALVLNGIRSLEHIKKGLGEVDALGQRRDLGAVRSTYEFSKILAKNGTNAAITLGGLDDSAAAVKEALKKVDELSARTDLGVVESTVEFGKIIALGGTKTILSALPFGSKLAGKLGL